MVKVFKRQKEYVCHGCFLTINLHCSCYQGANFAGASKVTTIQREAKLTKEKGSCLPGNNLEVNCITRRYPYSGCTLVQGIIDHEAHV
jgi:hypothetical protein